MNGIITRGYGKSKTIITRGYTGFFEQVVETVQRVIKTGKSKVDKLQEEFGNITISVKLITINGMKTNSDIRGTIRVTYRKILNKVSLVTEHIRTKINRRVSGILIHIDRVWRKK